jgi:hypothetical protein
VVHETLIDEDPVVEAAAPVGATGRASVVAETTWLGALAPTAFTVETRTKYLVPGVRLGMVAGLMLAVTLRAPSNDADVEKSMLYPVVAELTFALGATHATTIFAAPPIAVMPVGIPEVWAARTATPVL